ncbi:MAG: hypothetical protein L0H83_10060 [Salinisphaera sp.]|nr:hypothetical protein [Salinisphaera sp.]
MTTYIIEAGDLIMGEYEGDSPGKALDAYAQDAGYTSYQALVEQVGGNATATEKA